jgi:hypothetical protein
MGVQQPTVECPHCGKLLCPRYWDGYVARHARGRNRALPLVLNTPTLWNRLREIGCLPLAPLHTLRSVLPTIHLRKPAALNAGDSSTYAKKIELSRSTKRTEELTARGAESVQ